MSPGASLQDAFIRMTLPEKRPLTALINGRRANPESRLKPEDTLVIFPEICGG